MRTNYVLIDFESVQTRLLEHLTHDHFKVIVFVGASQAKLPFEVAVSLQRLGSRAQYIKISGHGLNALDFHIAYYIGRLAAENRLRTFTSLQGHGLRSADSASEVEENTRCMRRGIPS